MDRKTPLIIITGPTGSGKTSIMFDLARDYPIEVISADSMQVYRHMDIATAKPTKGEQKVLPHHLIDIREPDEEFNAGAFAALAEEKIPEIRSRGKIPVVVGGTGLYIKALLHGLAPALPRSAKLRSWLRSMIKEKGSPHLWEILYRLDPDIAKKISDNDAVRIIRSLEIIFLTGRKPSLVYQGHGFSETRHEAHILCLMPDRDILYRHIDSRVVGMVETGLVEETEKLLGLGFDPGLRSMQTLAYKHVIAYLKAEIGLEQAIGRIQRDTRRYAKRQITWMRSHHAPELFRNPDEAHDIIAGWLAESSS